MIKHRIKRFFEDNFQVYKSDHTGKRLEWHSIHIKIPFTNANIRLNTDKTQLTSLYKSLGISINIEE